MKDLGRRSNKTWMGGCYGAKEAGQDILGTMLQSERTIQKPIAGQDSMAEPCGMQ